jgi:hypothetical protein
MKIDFKPIVLADQKIFNSCLSRSPAKTSDYSFVNVWGWAAVYDLKWAMVDDLIWLCQTRPETRFWAPMGDWREVDWPRYFERYPQFRSALTRVPEPLARWWEKVFGQKVRISPDRDQFDYIYDAKALIELAGNRFHKKRNLLNQFLKNYDYAYEDLSASGVAAAMDMQADWCGWRECDSDAALDNENTAIKNVMRHWADLDGLVGGGIRVNGEMVAYTIAEPLEDDTLVIHFEKANTDYKGVYQAIHQMFLARAAAVRPAIHYVNREQDLGDAGLRRAKESYQPIGFLEKFQVDFLV